MSLKDITKIAENDFKGVTRRKRMSDGTIKHCKYVKPRKKIEIVFSCESDKLNFDGKLETLKEKKQFENNKRCV